MDVYPTSEVFLNVLGKTGLKYTLMTLQNGYFIIVTEHWGKVFGPFSDAEDAGALWLSKVVLDESNFRRMVAQDGWCIGGDRVWFAPEVHYNIQDRYKVRNEQSYSLPPQIDPGEYVLSEISEYEIQLSQDMSLSLKNTMSGIKKLRVERTISPVDDPLRHTAEYEKIISRVTFAGYRQKVALRDLTPDEAMTEVWNLIQLNPGGTILVPTAGYPEYQDYYEPIGRSHYSITDRHICFKITGDRKYKVGLKGASVFGRIGYVQNRRDGKTQLIIKNFFCNPSFPYIDEPIKYPGCHGDSVQVYNDDGCLGGFGEIEVHGCAVGGENGVTSTEDILDFWLYTGDEDSIDGVSYRLLGMSKAEL